MTFRSNSALEPEEKEQGIDGIKMIIDTGFIQLRYTDVLGKFLAKYVFGNKGTFDSFFKDGIGVDGSSVKGFASIDDSDMLLVPDRSTVRIFPPSLISSERSQLSSNYSNKLFAVIADVYQGFGKGRLVRDPRYVSQSMEEFLIENEINYDSNESEYFKIYSNVAVESTDIIRKAGNFYGREWFSDVVVSSEETEWYGKVSICFLIFIIIYSVIKFSKLYNVINLI